MHSFVTTLTLLPPEQTSEEDTNSVDCKQSTNRIELGGEDLEHYQCKRELADCGANIGALKGALCCPDLNQLIARQHHGARAMQVQTVSVCCVTALARRQSRRIRSRLVLAHFEHGQRRRARGARRGVGVDAKMVAPSAIGQAEQSASNR